MPRTRLFAFTLLAMLAFAGNSLLCRLALKETRIDAATFTSIRIISGAVALWLILAVRGSASNASGSWLSALALFAYAAAFSFAYTSLPAATGALLLFGAVQATMIGYGFVSGERLRSYQLAGAVVAFGGLVGLLLPGLSAPPLKGSLLMLVAGAAWGIYSLRGRKTSDPLRVTAGNFLRSVPFAAALSWGLWPAVSLDGPGLWYAIASGALTSGCGYALWYTALKGLKAVSAATIQLSVPVLTAFGGVIFLGEHVTFRVIGSSIAILGGISFVVLDRRPAK